MFTQAEILAGLTSRLTEPLAKLITTNFEVVNQRPDSLLSGFSATVWQGKIGTDYDIKDALIALEDGDYEFSATQASEFIKNWEVINHQPDSLLDGFSAIVWYGKVGIEYAGPTYSGTYAAKD